MRRLAILIFPAAPALASFDSLPRLIEVAAAAEDVSAKEAFDAAKELGTADDWEAFPESTPSGVHAHLARAYLKKLGAAGSAPTPKKADTKSKEPAKKQATQK